MLVLVSFALVLLALMLLILGVLSSDGLSLIYVSILCSLGAGAVLFLATRPKTGKSVPKSAPEGPATGMAPPLGMPGEMKPVSVAAGPNTMTTPVVDPYSPASAGGTANATVQEQTEQPFFPIADYDDLTIAEILPLLKELYDDELETVQAHESLTKERLAVMTAIKDIRDRLATTDEDVTFAEMTAMGVGVAEDDLTSLRVPSAWESDVYQEDLEEDEWEVEAEEEEEEYEDEEDEEWAESSEADRYEDLSISELRDLLSRLDEDELLRLRDVEEQGQQRRSVLAAIDRELALFEPEPVVRRAPARKAPAKKAPARKAPAKKAPARKAPAKKAPARKAVAKKAPARKAPAKKAPARKAVAKKAPARKAPAHKAAVKKTTKRTR